MSDERSYLKRYAKFFLERATAEGYEFQHGPGNVPPPKVTFMQTLRWWSMDRWPRMKKIRAERDRRLQDILKIKSPPSA